MKTETSEYRDTAEQIVAAYGPAVKVLEGIAKELREDAERVHEVDVSCPTVEDIVYALEEGESYIPVPSISIECRKRYSARDLVWNRGLEEDGNGSGVHGGCWSFVLRKREAAQVP